KGPDQFTQLMNDPSKLTTVRVEFHEVSGMTRVIVSHMGWGDGEGWAEAREWHKTAWKDVLEKLKSVLESE
ncbi:MAG: SRPBCC domain-containing protein, partial [Thermoplasmata archaeon]|nr:SRPBCC domain-containing protein [Thermoplasmata archaeon]